MPPAVGACCARSSRSLQRALADEATAWSALLERVRVDAATRLLADPERSVTEVGYACGFSDSAHFSRRFRLAKGAAPSVWREQESPATTGK